MTDKSTQSRFLFACPKCRVISAAKDDYLGTLVLCPKCKTPIRISDDGEEFTPQDLPVAIGSHAKDGIGGLSGVPRVMILKKGWMNLPLLPAQAKRILRYAGGNPDVKSISGMTLLHTAVKQGRRDTVAFLMQIGANVNVTDDKGYAPLHFAAGDGYTDLARVLLQHGSKFGE